MGATSALQQPQQAPLIDRSNPITRGLTVAILPLGGTFVDVINNKFPTTATLATTPGVLAGVGRVTQSISDSHSAVFTGNVYTRVGPNGAFTEFAIVAPTTFPYDYAALWSSGNTTPGVAFLTLMRRASNTNNINWSVDTGSWGVDSAGNELTTLTDGKAHTLLGCNDENELRIDVDGKAVVNTTGILATSVSPGRLILFADFDNGAPSNGSIGLYLRWERKLSEAESRSLKLNSWQVFYKSAAALSAFTAGGGATDTPINPGAGSLAITGYAPTVAQPRTAAPGVGTLALTGYAPTVVQNVAVAPGVGSLSITGYAPAITQPQTAAPVVGAIAITGYAPAVVQNTLVAPGVGSLTIAGFAPTVAQPQAVNPGAGALVLTGYAPSVSQPQTALPGAGSITITGYAPTVAQAAGQNVAPGVGTLAITGYAPSIAQPQTAAPGAGSISITGYAPSVVQNTQAAPGAGSVALTGYAPAVTQQINVTAGAGLLTLTGYAPSVARTANQAVAPGVGALAISGFAPTVVQASASITLTPSVGQITITGYAPDVQQSVDQRTTGAGSDIGGGAERRPRYWHDAQRKPLLQRVLEARAEERRVKPVKERQRKRAKEVEVEAAKVVLRASSADSGEERFGELMRQWLAQRPVLPGGGDAMDFFLAQVAFRLAQMDALDKAAAAFAAMDDDEEELLALLLA